MAEYPYLPLWTDALLGDIQHLDTVEIGAYMMMLIVSWRRPHCDIPDDPKFLSKITRLSKAQWQRRADTLRAFFKVETNPDGESVLVQKRLKKERSFVQKNAQQKRTAANARWLKHKETDNAAAYAAAMQPTPTPTPTPLNTSSVDKSTSEATPPDGGFPDLKRLPKNGHGREYPEPFGAFWEIWPANENDTKASAYTSWRKAVRSGIDPETLYGGACKQAELIEAKPQRPRIHVQTWINREGWTASYEQGGGIESLIAYARNVHEN